MKLLLILFLAMSVWLGSAFAVPPVKKNSFVEAPPKNGRYAPWRDQNDSIKYFAGEIITLSGSEFRYQLFTDALEVEMIIPDWSGRMKISEDHIYLDHPGVPFPYRITGYLDGVFVMTTWRAFEHWKKFGSMRDYDVLFLETKKEPKRP